MSDHDDCRRSANASRIRPSVTDHDVPVPMNASRMVRSQRLDRATLESRAEWLAGLDEIADDPQRADADRRAGERAEAPAQIFERPLVLRGRHGDHHRPGRDQADAGVPSQEPEARPSSPPIAAVAVGDRSSRQHHDHRRARSPRTVPRSTPPMRCARSLGWRRMPVRRQRHRRAGPGAAAAIPSAALPAAIATMHRRSSPTRGCGRRGRAAADTPGRTPPSACR